MPLCILLLASTAAAQSETVVARVPGRTTGCSLGGWTMSVPEIVAPNEVLFVRFTGPAQPMPAEIAVTLRGPSGRTQRTATYQPDERPMPICDSVGPTPCGPSTRTASFGVRFEGSTLSSEGEHQIEAGPPGARSTCSSTVRVSAALARGYRAHRGPQSTAGFAGGGYLIRSWELVRTQLGRGTYEVSRAILGEPDRPIEIDVSEPVRATDLTAYFRRLRRVSFDAVNAGNTEAAPSPGPADPSDPAVLSAVFYSEQLLFMSVSSAGFEIAWQVSAAVIPSGRAIVRIRGRELGPSERAIIASYLGTLHPSSPPALP